MDHVMIDQDCSRAGVEPASKVSVYTGSSGLSQPVGGAEYPGHGASGSLDQQEQQEQQEQQQEQEQAAPPLTDTIAMGLQSMEDRRLQIHAMIDEVAQVGLHFLEQQRQSFLQTLEKFKDDVDGFCAEEAAKNQQLSCDTLAAHERLNRAQLLVQSLGGAVCQPGAGLMG